MKDITYSLDEIIEIIKKITDKNYYVTLEGVNFKLEQLILLQKKFNENSRLLEGFSIQIEENLSMRRALIALLQEKYYTRKTYEGIEIKLSQLQNIANSRFVIKNKDTRNFKTPQDIHPKNPCLHYEDDIDSNNNISLYELKAKGLILLSNRPLNTTYENKVLRLSDSYIQDIDIVEKNENLLFGSFGAKIKQRLSDIKEDTMLEKYYPIHFFIENRKMIANQEAIDKSINILLIPFLEAIGLKNEKMFQILRDLRNYWIIFSKYDNQNRLDNLKDKLYNEKKIIKNDNRDFSLTLAEKYIEKGIDTVLMGLTKKNYIDKIKSIL